MTRKLARFGGTALAGALLILAGCNASDNESATAAATSTARTWSEFRDAFLAGYFPLNPTFAVYQGKHEYDGQLPDWSPQGIEKQAAFLEKTIADAKAFDGAMTDAEKFERDYLVHVAEGQLFFLRDTDFVQKNPAFYIGALDPNVYIARPYADPATRMKAFIAYAEKVPAAAAQIKANLILPLPATFVKFGTAGFGGFAEYYTGDAKAAFANVKDAALHKQFDEAVARAAAAMKDLAAFVGSQAGTAGGYALGADKFAKYRPGGSQAEPGRAQGGVRDLCRRSDDRGLHEANECRQARGRPGCRGASAASGTPRVPHRKRSGLDTGNRTGRGRGVATL